MPKRSSTNWFRVKSQQQTMSNIAQLPTIAKTGPRPDTTSRREDEQGRSFFVAGKSEIGGDEVI